MEKGTGMKEEVKKMRAEPKEFTPLPPLDWKKIQPPVFKRSFMDASTLDLIQKDTTDDWLKKLPPCACAFLESTTGTTFAKPTLVQRDAWPQLLHGSNIMCVVSAYP
jgi:superfamily II DNA/RNA helicase